MSHRFVGLAKIVAVVAAVVAEVGSVGVDVVVVADYLYDCCYGGYGC